MPQPLQRARMKKTKRKKSTTEKETPAPRLRRLARALCQLVEARSRSKLLPRVRTKKRTSRCTPGTAIQTLLYGLDKSFVTMAIDLDQSYMLQSRSHSLLLSSFVANLCSDHRLSSIGALDLQCSLLEPLQPLSLQDLRRVLS